LEKEEKTEKMIKILAVNISSGCVIRAIGGII